MLLIIRLFLCGALFLSSFSNFILAHGVLRAVGRVLPRIGNRIAAPAPRGVVAANQIHIAAAPMAVQRKLGGLRSTNDLHARDISTNQSEQAKLKKPLKNTQESEAALAQQLKPQVVTSGISGPKSVWDYFIGISIVAAVLAFFSTQEKTIENTEEKPVQVAVPLKRAVTWDVLNAELDRFAATMQTQFTQAGVWFNGAPTVGAFDLAGPQEEFKPYAQKLLVPAGSSLMLFGDLHGEEDSFHVSLKKLMADGFLGADLKVTDKNGSPTYFVFHGDYVDRGSNGVEVLDTLMRLKNANPERVFMVRGNHEDINQNAQSGFFSEMNKKFGAQDFMPRAQKVFRMYDLLPNVLFVGCKDTDGTVNWHQCCHGGLELGYNPQELFNFESSKPYACQMITQFDRAATFKKLEPALQKEVDQYNHQADRLGLHLNKMGELSTMNGHMWSDCIPDDGKKAIDFKRGRGWAFGQKVTQAVLELFSSPQHKLRGLFRAHQHHGEMLEHLRCSQHKGIVQLWQEFQPNHCQTCKFKKEVDIPVQENLWPGVVCTFLSTPVQGTGFKYHAYGHLKIAHRYEDWRLSMNATKIAE